MCTKLMTMHPWFREYLLRGAALVGLATSVLLLAEYQSDAPLLCGIEGGCGAVRRSAFAFPLGVPLPVLGVLYFAAIVAASGLRPLRRLLSPLALLGAAGAVALLAIQAFVIGEFCRLCIIVDTSSLLIGGLALSLRGTMPPARPQPWSAITTVLGASVVALTVAGPWWYHTVHADAVELNMTRVELPPEIAREQRPGVVTIVEFLDFHCPACRAQHEQLKPVLAAYGDQVRLVIKHMPLPVHAKAIDAARGYVCAEEQGVTRPMADALFAASHAITADVLRIATELQLDLDRFKRCLGADATARRIAQDRAMARELEVQGLPTYFIGDERFYGVHSASVISASIERARRRQ
jgi:predicted DsbA family dithiol-disulfide isomerase/uncharacterized membrane protein